MFETAILIPQQVEPRHYRSNYTFNAIEDGDLTVFEGEVVTGIPCPLDTTDDQVNNAVEDGWLLATNARGETGKVPENVRPPSSVSLAKKMSYMVMPCVRFGLSLCSIFQL